jgi:hypothetical protein
MVFFAGSNGIARSVNSAIANAIFRVSEARKKTPGVQQMFLILI